MPRSAKAVKARRFILIVAAAYAVSRALAYAPWIPRSVQEPLIVATGDGFLLPLYATAWAVAGLGCLLHLRSAELGWGFYLVIGFMAVWAVFWTAGGLLTDFPVWWQTAMTYGGPAGIIAGLIYLIRIFVGDESKGGRQ